MLPVIFFVIPISLAFGLQKTDLSLSVDYLKYREVKFACLISCEDNIWPNQFAKIASRESIAVSHVQIDDSFNNFRLINKCIYQGATSVGVLINAQCQRFEELLQYASENMFFDANHKWLIITDVFDSAEYFNDTRKVVNESYSESYPSKIQEVLENLNISVDADIIVTFKSEDFKYTLIDAYNYGKIQGGNLIFKQIGFWSIYEGFILSFNLNEYKYYRRWNFEQFSFRMAVVMGNGNKELDPEMLISREPTPGVALITKTSAMILNEVAQIHNFRYNYAIFDRWIGDFNKSTTKVVATDIYYRRQDITPVLRFLLTEFNKFQVLHPPVTSIETRYFYRIPTHGPGKFENQFLRPLTTEVWICSMVITLLCALALLIAAKIERRPMPAQYAVFSVLASFCQQFFEDSGDAVAIRQSVGRKIAVLVTGLSCLLIYNYYTSSVVSWLLNGPPPSINSLEELLESPLELIYEDIGYARSWLQTPSYYFNKRNAKVEDEIRLKKVINKKKDARLFVTVDDGIEMVKAGGYAYHTETDTANKLISRKFTQMELCELGSLPSMEKTSLYASVQSSSPYKEFFVWSLARLAERGITSCVQHRTSSDPVGCGGSSPRALALGGAAPAFILLAFGYLFATVIMFFERLFHRRYVRKNQSRMC